MSAAATVAQIHQTAQRIKEDKRQQIAHMASHSSLLERIFNRRQRWQYFGAKREMHSVNDRNYNEELNAAINSVGFAPKLTTIGPIISEGAVTRGQVDAANARLNECYENECRAMNEWYNNVRRVLTDCDGIRHGPAFWAGAVSLRSLTIHFMLDNTGGPDDIMTITGAWGKLGIFNSARMKARDIWKIKRVELDKRYGQLYSDLMDPEIRRTAGRADERLRGASYVEKDMKSINDTGKAGNVPILGLDGILGSTGQKDSNYRNPKEAVERTALKDEFMNGKITRARELLDGALRAFRADDNEDTRRDLATALTGMLALFAPKEEHKKLPFVKLMEKVLKDMREGTNPIAGELRKIERKLEELLKLQRELNGPGFETQENQFRILNGLLTRMPPRLTKAERKELAKLDAEHEFPVTLKHLLLPDEKLTKDQAFEVKRYLMGVAMADYMNAAEKKHKQVDEIMRRKTLNKAQFDALDAKLKKTINMRAVRQGTTFILSSQQLEALQKEMEAISAEANSYGAKQITSQAKFEKAKEGRAMSNALRNELRKLNEKHTPLPPSLLQFIGSGGDIDLAQNDVENARGYLELLARPDWKNNYLHTAIRELGRLRMEDNTGIQARPEDFDMAKGALKRYKNGLGGLAKFFAA